MNRRNFISTAAALLAAPAHLIDPTAPGTFSTFSGGPVVFTLPAGYWLERLDHLTAVYHYRNSEGHLILIPAYQLWGMRRV